MAIGVGRLFKKTASAAGRGMSRIGGSKAGMMGIAAGAFGLGVLNSVAPAARDAAFESVMGDPNADYAFTGRKLDTRFMAGHSMGGIAGRALSYTAPGDAISFAGEPRLGGGTGGALTVGGAAAGMAFGAYRGMRSGAGIKGKIGSTILGAIGGATIGGAIAPSVIGFQTAALMRNNQQFYDQSPYATRNSSRSLIHSTGAVGDIVLGMHNSRNGY